jgi:myo-inositol-1(or 4)-monophosphatase
MNYIEMQTHLVKITRAAGEYIRGSSALETTDKTNTKDFVTKADIEAQRIIVEGIEAVMPKGVVLSEEYPPEKQQQLYQPDFTGFVVDPIDGTYNFKHDMGASGVSIGYIENGEPMVGVIYNPFKDEMYTAIKGRGAFCNNQPIHVAATETLDSANVITDNSYEDAAMARTLKRHLAIYDQTGTMPWTGMHGSAVLALADIARGRVDAYHHSSLKPWDNAAGILLVREAGGVVWTLEGKEASFTSPGVLAGTPKVAAILKDVFAKIDPELLS